MPEPASERPEAASERPEQASYRLAKEPARAYQASKAALRGVTQ